MYCPPLNLQPALLQPAAENQESLDRVWCDVACYSDCTQREHMAYALRMVG